MTAPKSLEQPAKGAARVLGTGAVPRAAKALNASSDPGAPSPTVTAGPTAESLRALSHPLRLQLFREMIENPSPVRAADLSQRTGVPDNAMSYHLRRLLKAGLILLADPPEGSTRRDRWYIADQTKNDWSATDLGKEPEIDQAIGAVIRQTYMLLAERVIDTQTSDDGPWFHGDKSVWLTPDEAAELVAQMEATYADLISRRDRRQERPTGQRERRYLLAIDLVPEKPGSAEEAWAEQGAPSS